MPFLGTNIRGILHGIKVYWRGYIIIIWPLLCLVVFLAGTEPQWRCAYVILIMALFWVTEAIPLGVTSMIPMFAWPLLDILPTNETCKEYFSATNIMFFAGLVVAETLEYSLLHLRIAYRSILIIGTTHIRLSFAIAALTTLLSYWVSNTATTAMMGPIIKAILIELQSQGVLRFYEDGSDPNAKVETDRFPTRTTTFYFLISCFCSNSGGIGTIIGTGTNLAGKGLLETRFPDMPPISFGHWSALGVPFTIIVSFLTWLWLLFLFMGLGNNRGMDIEIKEAKEKKTMGKEVDALIRGVVRQKHEEMGPMNWHQVIVTILFLIIVFLWIFRDPGFMPGWESITPQKITDASPGIFIVVVSFLIPQTCQFWKSYSKYPEDRPEDEKTEGAMTWRYLNSHMPWDLLFLLGGGFAIAKGAKECGLTRTLGEGLRVLENLSRIWILVSVSLFASLCTEITSNVAICNVVLPIVMEMSVVIKVNPLYLCLPVIWSCSFAYMQPVGTPPNLVAKALSNFKSKDMLLPGLGVKLMALLFTVLFMETLGDALYDFQTYPNWAV